MRPAGADIGTPAEQELVNNLIEVFTADLNEQNIKITLPMALHIHQIIAHYLIALRLEQRFLDDAIVEDENLPVCHSEPGTPSRTGVSVERNIMLKIPSPTHAAFLPIPHYLLLVSPTLFSAESAAIYGRAL